MIPGVVAAQGLYAPAPAPGYSEKLPASFSQSSTWEPHTATVANMRDTDYTTGGATNLSGTAWIQADMGSPQAVDKVLVAGGGLSGWGGVAAYLNGAEVQYYDGSAWQTVATVSGVEDSGPNVQKEYSFTEVTAQLFRLSTGSYLSTTEFRLYGST